MAAGGIEDKLDCHICQNVSTEPVRLPCGHYFCLVCIREHFNSQDESHFYTCPQCGKRFTARPALQRNTEQSERENPPVTCTYCINPSAPALKTCLQCEASLCDTHLAAHRALGHSLVNATNSLQNQKCSDHNQLLKYYCPQDAACICTECHLLGRHRGHPVDSMNEAAKKRKEKLENDLQKLASKTEEAEVTIQSLRKSSSIEVKKGQYVEDQVISIFRDLKERLHDLERNVLFEVSRQKSKISSYYSNLISELDRKYEEQCWTMRDIKERLHTSDPLYFLQQRDPIEATTCGADKDKYKEGPDITELDVNLILGNVYRSLSAILTYSFPADLNHKFMKEEGATTDDKIKTEEDPGLGGEIPNCEDMPVHPVINGGTYRLEMKSAGLFRCMNTGIKFQVKGPLTIEYEFDSWGNHMTQVHRDGYEIISQLFNIRTVVQPGVVLAVHLPHFLSAADCEVYKPYVKCVHYRPGKIMLESPTRIESSYIVLENPSFCCLGALIEKVWMYLSSFFSFPGVVLIYGKKCLTKYLIHLYLVPDYETELKEVIHTKKQKDGFHLIDKPAYIRNACTRKIYIVSGPQGSSPAPKELHFLFTKPSAQYPYSAIRVDNSETSISLNIRESDSADNIWECQLEDDDLERLSEARNSPTADSQVFVRKHSKALCERMPLLPPLLRELRHRGVINVDEEDEILHHTLLVSEKNRKLLEMIKKKGAEEEFYNVLKEKDPRLVEDLERT